MSPQDLPPDWRSKMQALLLDLYSASELRRTVVDFGIGRDADLELPGEIASDRALAFGVVETLSKHGLIDGFFDRMYQERKNRREDIENVHAAKRADHRSWMSKVVPRQSDPRLLGLAEELARLKRDRALLQSQGRDSKQHDIRILEIKRDMRVGPLLNAGEHLGQDRFELVEQIGQGGFAHVWTAYDCMLERIVVLRVLHGDYVRSEQRLDRFKRGGRLMDLTRHPRVVPVIESGIEDRGFFFQVLEYMVGGDLHRAVLEKRLSGREALTALLRVSEALEYAHSLDLVHRDMKPHNVLLNQRGEAFLTDFDLVLSRDSTGGTGTVALGSFIYAAPEAMQDARTATQRSDVYGLAMTAVFCLYGADLPMMIIRDTLGFLENMGLEQRLRASLLRALEWDPARRMASVSEFRVELRDALAGRSTLGKEARERSNLASIAEEWSSRGEKASSEGRESDAVSDFARALQWADRCAEGPDAVCERIAARIPSPLLAQVARADALGSARLARAALNLRLGQEYASKGAWRQAIQAMSEALEQLRHSVSRDSEIKCQVSLISALLAAGELDAACAEALRIHSAEPMDESALAQYWALTAYLGQAILRRDDATDGVLVQRLVARAKTLAPRSGEQSVVASRRLLALATLLHAIGEHREALQTLPASPQPYLPRELRVEMEWLRMALLVDLARADELRDHLKRATGLLQAAPPSAERVDELIRLILILINSGRIGLASQILSLARLILARLSSEEGQPPRLSTLMDPLQSFLRVAHGVRLKSPLSKLQQVTARRLSLARSLSGLGYLAESEMFLRAALHEQTLRREPQAAIARTEGLLAELIEERARQPEASRRWVSEPRQRIGLSGIAAWAKLAASELEEIPSNLSDAPD